MQHCRVMHVSDIMSGLSANDISKRYCKLTFLSVTDMYVRTHTHPENRSPIQSLALRRSRQSKKTQEMTATFPLKNTPSCGICETHIPVQTLEGSLFPFPRINRQNPLENTDPKPSGDSSRWILPAFKGSIPRVFCCDEGVS